MSLSSAGILTVADDIIIGDGKTIGSASDPDAITIASGGGVTFSQVPVFPNNTVESADIQADAITGAKIADDAINSEHYTDGSIDTAHIADVNVTQGKIADQAINEAKMQISNAPQNGYMLTAQSGNTGGMTWAEAGGGAWNLLSTVTASDDGRIDCTLSGSYSNYAIILSGVSPVTDNVQLQARMSTASTTSDGGSNYRYICASSLDDGGTNTYQSQGATFIKIVRDSLGNAAGESLEATIHIGHDSDHQNSTRLNILSAHTGNAGRACTNNACGVYNPRVAVTAINFLMSSGNVNYGIFKVYGIS